MAHRFIPAGAGNSWVNEPPAPGVAVYPRWRGELIAQQLIRHANDGLSPLARGTPNRPQLRPRGPRFIPAGAGNSVRAFLYSAPNSVYPRWHGELCIKCLFFLINAGLSPLARGTRRHGQWGQQPDRFIPAGAGNSQKRVLQRVDSPVYPRWRGELKISKAFPHPQAGLSPLARGTLLDVRRLGRSWRFIPAGAGNSSSRLRKCRLTSVYPRWRGELARILFGLWDLFGLSPLARGTLCRKIKEYENGRFIPAGAGNSLFWHRHRGVRTVYPRWRGELSQSIHLFLKHFFP